MSLNFKSLYKALQKELSIINRKTHEIHLAKEIEKKKALLQYKKLHLLRERKPTNEIEKELEDLSTTKIKPPKLNNTILKEIISEESDKDDNLKYVKLNNLWNVSNFFSSQRTYTELIERYNPGLTMTQEDKVRRTANKVGLSVPENNV